jgi:hypothetical protein
MYKFHIGSFIGLLILLGLAGTVIGNYVANPPGRRNTDTAIKAITANMRASAELFHDSHNSYSGYCDSKEALILIEDIRNRNNNKLIKCLVGEQSYIFISKFKVSENYWCMDSLGKGIEIPEERVNLISSPDEQCK